MSFSERNQDQSYKLTKSKNFADDFTHSLSQFFMPLKWKYFIRKTKRTSFEISLAASCLPGSSRWDGTQLAANTWTLPTHPSPMTPFPLSGCGQASNVSDFSGSLTTAWPFGQPCKDLSSCPYLLTTHFKAPLIIFFRKFSSSFLSVIKRSTASGLRSSPASPGQSIQEQRSRSHSMPYRLGSSNPHKCFPWTTSINMHLVWQSRFTGTKRRRGRTVT